MKVEQLTDSLYKITLALNEFEVNLGVCVGDDGILLIDTGWIMTAEDLRDRIKEIKDGPVKLSRQTAFVNGYLDGALAVFRCGATAAGPAPARGVAHRQASGALYRAISAGPKGYRAEISKAPARRDGQALARRLRLDSGPR